MGFNDGYLSTVNVTPRQDNDGYLFGRNSANGVASVTFTLSADPVPFCVAEIVFTATGEGRTVAQAEGAALFGVSLLGQGTANRGVGLAELVFAVTGQANPATGQAEITFTVTGAGDLHSHFAPKLVWSGATLESGNLIIPLAALPELPAAEADAVTGDWREILQALLRAADDYHQAMPATRLPRTFQSNLLVDWNYPHPTLGRVIKREFWTRYIIDLTTRRVADEV